MSPTRKKPHCRTCNRPMAGHNRAECEAQSPRRSPPNQRATSPQDASPSQRREQEQEQEQEQTHEQEQALTPGPLRAADAPWSRRLSRWIQGEHFHQIDESDELQQESGTPQIDRLNDARPVTPPPRAPNQGSPKRTPLRRNATPGPSQLPGPMLREADLAFEIPPGVVYHRKNPNWVDRPLPAHIPRPVIASASLVPTELVDDFGRTIGLNTSPPRYIITRDHQNDNNDNDDQVTVLHGNLNNNNNNAIHANGNNTPGTGTGSSSSNTGEDQENIPDDDDNRSVASSTSTELYNRLEELTYSAAHIYTTAYANIPMLADIGRRLQMPFTFVHRRSNAVVHGPNGAVVDADAEPQQQQQVRRRRRQVLGRADSWWMILGNREQVEEIQGGQRRNRELPGLFDEPVSPELRMATYCQTFTAVFIATCFASLMMVYGLSLI